MIENGFLFLSILIGMTALIVWAEYKIGGKFFKYVPAIVLIYLGAAFMNTFGLFGDSESLSNTSYGVRNALLPAMILLMLLQCDLRKIIKLGPKLLITYFVAAFSIVLGFTLTYLVMQSFFLDDTWRAFSALAGSWTGGSANMVALQDILAVPETIFGYALIMDTINYSFWVLVMFWLVPFERMFNRWTKADTSKLESMSQEIAATVTDEKREPTTFVHMIGLLGFSLFIAALATVIGENLPQIGTGINAMTWTILIVSIVGLLLALTPFASIPGSMDIGRVMLYTIVAIIASGADFSSIGEIPVYIIAGFMVLLFHGLILFGFAKLFKLDLFTLGVASLANIGGMVSAPVLAGAFNRALIPVGVIMALIGGFMGTWFGVLTAEILSRL
ncbi:DUF819 family protein [Halalkalibacterium halodurans]|uniref:DUF819 family protein n=1 Tax=Halalkalibacterium halodurans TaxID=86665 RepID=UPI002E1EAD8D|nr:DUF819 family protein [Halalkalibacterium halodurans]